MMPRSTLRQKLRDPSGATLVYVAVLLVVLFAFVALAIDIAYAMVARNELQNVADAAALAGARQLGSEYEPLTNAQQAGYVCSPGTISTPVVEVAGLNTAANQPISIRSEDIKIGTWNGQTRSLTETLNQPDAVSVTARRDSLANGPVSTFFAQIIGIDTMDVSAVAIAALTGVTKIEPGELIPVGISKEWFDATPQFCGQPIQFHPSNAATGCAGWDTFYRSPASDSYLRKDILQDWLAGTFTSPGAAAGDSFTFSGGTLSNPTFAAFNDLFNYMKTRDGDGDDTAWSASVAVYSNIGCSNPTGTIPIVGFAAAKITSIELAPAKTINAVVICNLIEPGRGGGAYYGVKGAIPGLVK